jgi:hypothetical protein
VPIRATVLPRAIFALILLAIALATTACTAGPTPASLGDPREILSAAVAHLRASRSVHLDVKVDGTLALTGAIGSPDASPRGLALTGTHVEGDLDLQARNADVRFQVPALLGLEGELRQVGDDAYLESSLTSRGWHRLSGDELPLDIGSPLDWIDGLTTWLDRPAALPVRLDDGPCAAGRCAIVSLTLYPDDLRAMASAAPSLDDGIAGASVSIELRVERSSSSPSEAVITIDLGPRGEVRLDVVFSAWDAPLAIVPPASSEIVPGPLLP